MSLTGETTILLPVDVSTDETPAEELLDLLGPVNVVVLGYVSVPDQAVPAQIRDETEAAATERLERIGARLEPGGGSVTELLVYTHDRDETVDRVAEEYDCDAVLTPGEAGTVGRVLVAVRGRENLDRVTSLVASLLAAVDASVTLFHGADADMAAGRRLLEDATTRLTEAGVDRERIETRLAEDVDPADEIVRLAADADVLVLGETKPSLRERILGDAQNRVLRERDEPIFVVRDPS